MFRLIYIRHHFRYSNFSVGKRGCGYTSDYTAYRDIQPMIEDPNDARPEDPPKTEGESGSGSGRPPAKARVGTGDNFGRYRPGQVLVCRIVAGEPGGYAVMITKDNLPGFLATGAKMRINEEVLARFVCIHNSRVLLSLQIAETSSNVTEPTQTTFRYHWKGEKQPNSNLRRAIDLIPPL